MSTTTKGEVCPESLKHNELEMFDRATYCGIIVNEPQECANTQAALTKSTDWSST